VITGALPERLGVLVVVRQGPRGDALQIQPVGEDQRRAGGSTWQSLRRGTGTIETDYLTGEIVLLGRLHGVPTPANQALQVAAAEMARTGEPPASRSADDVLRSIERGIAEGWVEAPRRTRLEPVVRHRSPSSVLDVLDEDRE